MNINGSPVLAALVVLVVLSAHIGRLVSGATSTGHPEPLTWSMTADVGHHSPFGRSGQLRTVSFSSARFCAATDGNGDVFTTTDPGDDAVTWRRQLVAVAGRSDSWQATTAAIAAVTCAEVARCVATDDAGNALITTRPAIASGEWVKQTVGDGAVLWDVTCPNPSRWVAGDIDRRVLPGAERTTAPVRGGTTGVAVRSREAEGRDPYAQPRGDQSSAAPGSRASATGSDLDWARSRHRYRVK